VDNLLPTPAAPERRVTLSDFAYHIPLEKFVYRHPDRSWNTGEMVSKEGIRNHLLWGGWSMPEIKILLQEGSYLRVHGTDFAPGKEPLMRQADGRFYLNTWIRPTLEPLPGEYPTIERILAWLTNDDQDAQLWLCSWMAAKVQKPDFVPKVAVVLAAEQGTGKGTLASVLQRMLGEANCATIERSALENKFNSRWIDKVFVLADEVLSHDNLKDVSNLLKVLIDGSEIEIERKGKDQRTIRNKLAWMFASNDKVAPVVLESSDRRYSVFSNHNMLTPEYDALLKGCFVASDKARVTPTFAREIQAFYYDLLHMDVDYVLISKPYANVSRAELIEANLSSHEMFFKSVQESGVDEWLVAVLRKDWNLEKARGDWDFGEHGLSLGMLYACYVEFCRTAGGKPLKINRFGVAVRNHRPIWEHSSRMGASKKRVHCYKAPRKI
jgi:hypothetical protein